MSDKVIDYKRSPLKQKILALRKGDCRWSFPWFPSYRKARAVGMEKRVEDNSEVRNCKSKDTGEGCEIC